VNDAPKKTKWQEFKEKNGLAPLDLLDLKAQMIDDARSQERIAICITCPELVPVANQCKKCGCFVESKVKPETAKCPLGKW